MVTGKNGDPYLVQARFHLSLHTGQLHRHRLQMPQGAGGFGQLLLASLRLFDGLGVDGFAWVQPPGLDHNAFPFKVRGRPATVSTTRWQRSASA
ncbi:hypothetical protein D3C73_1272880 [compost metagenome]